MKTAIPYRTIPAVLLITAVAFALACSGNQGGMTLEETQRQTDEALRKQERKTRGTERLERELVKIPAKEQLTNTPYRDTLGPYILERQEGGQYKFYVAPPEDVTTGEMPAANTLIAAVVDYKKVDDGPYVIVEKNETIPGYRLDAEVTLIDHTIPAVIHRKTFKGEKPKPGLAGSNSIYIKEGEKQVVGNKPFDEIQKWLSGLPRRK